ncbi:hypothetical protein Dvina_01465 [Dactylosporangium vinaceum]|uniref:Uncharacterized protein n=1 Tax=Dactylosporangium vinaceum TaxID=53362 RepID=A0ABV5MLM8_9ACTN|nr:hypothetical protein [Dactylosporangium vinaceum]UAB96927.1 hypothetical protein Dvina_01465 [Dactylosporangium vinaceum]
MREEHTRLVPHEPHEVEWARQRPAQHRTKLPAVGDEVLYRHHDWGLVVPAEVLWLQPFDDLDDPNLWTVQRDPLGQPLTLDGRPVLQQRLDPWPLLRLKVEHLGPVLSREARLRGAAGWLPLDWQRRYRPMPNFTAIGA